jgi:cation transport ATPase
MQRAAYSLIFVAVEQELAGIIALDDTPRAETGGWVC